MRKISVETNKYDFKINPPSECNHKNFRGEKMWFPLHPSKLRTFLLFFLYIWIKIEPNVWCYLNKLSEFLWYPLISFIMTRSHYLHVHNDHGATMNDQGVEFDKLVKLRWLLDEITDRCKGMWNLGDKVIIDKMMIQHKGKYCNICLYMPKKPTKWEFKTWCLKDSELRYVWTFEIYCGANKRILGIKDFKNGEAI